LLDDAPSDRERLTLVVEVASPECADLSSASSCRGSEVDDLGLLGTSRSCRSFDERCDLDGARDNGDGRLDVVTSNKKGTTVCEQVSLAQPD